MCHVLQAPRQAREKPSVTCLPPPPVAVAASAELSTAPIEKRGAAAASGYASGRSALWLDRKARAAHLPTCPPHHHCRAPAPCRCASAHHARALAGAQSATRRAG
jgi:hypothetical protein